MFDQELIKKNKIRSALYVKNSDFFQFIYSDLIDRLGSIDKEYQDMLWIGDQDHLLGYPELDSGSREMTLTFLLPCELSHKVKDGMNKKFDLICFPYALHWIDDIQKFLRQVRDLLKEDGIFICNFPGAGSLAHLRKTLFLAEEACNQPHSPHFSPFIKFDDVASLLQQAGFAENITDYEYLFLEYDSAIALMKELKKLGESNALVSSSHYSITKSMYRLLQDQEHQPFQDQVNLITWISSTAKHSIKLKSQYFTK